MKSNCSIKLDPDSFEDPSGSGLILDRSGMDDDHQQQSECVDRNCSETVKLRGVAMLRLMI